ncbi:hypothetical protein B0H12DRAFT_1101331 [Mycena haematopus]|nr:hypothetical protein B0H12DRAFT_1101331 [Mycena haematopus]
MSTHTRASLGDLFLLFLTVVLGGSSRPSGIWTSRPCIRVEVGYISRPKMKAGIRRHRYLEDAARVKRLTRRARHPQ